LNYLFKRLNNFNESSESRQAGLPDERAETLMDEGIAEMGESAASPK
jgi:hypothetical protein